MVRRIYSEKKKGFDIEARSLYEELRYDLGIESLRGVRIINRYDIEGISDEEFEKAVNIVFSEPPVDNAYKEDYPCGTDEIVIPIESLPGQFDQRADSAAQCVQLLTCGEMPAVRYARIILLKGRLSDGDIAGIRNYCINPVETREASLKKPDTLAIAAVIPSDIKTIEGFISMDGPGLSRLAAEMRLAMSLEDMVFCRGYFAKEEKRDPTETEMRVIDTYWSDHCRHTTFLTEIGSINIENGEYAAVIKKALESYYDIRREVYGEIKDCARQKKISLMDIATIPVKYFRKKGLLKDLDISDEINACSIIVEADTGSGKEEWLVMFKNETHNHPTEIEPFGGAATCLGGAIRDPLSGRAYVYQAMRVTGSGNPNTKVEDTLPGKLPQRKITKGAAAGFSSYGNQIGLATGQVEELYHEGFIAKRLEVGAVIGAVKKSSVKREKPQPGDVVILLGGRTGRDGCGGATGSSKTHDENSLSACGSEVQKGNPPTERKIQRLFRKPEVSLLIKKCNDFGAGGVSVAIGELAEGLDIDLDLVPRKYEGLDGTELAISESQERMAVVVSSQDSEKFIKEARLENLESVAVAVVTDSRRLRMKWRGRYVADISRDFLDTNGAVQHAEAFIRSPSFSSGAGIFSIKEDEAFDAQKLKQDWEKN
ncbi:MAG: AIR synthase-related protein, partial [Eubacteriales bacterium]|nr:AIR synthase-related protein [Eubacteriales bacterium]